MCESKVVFKKGDSEELLMEDVVRIEVENGKLKLYGLLGEYREVEGKIALMDMRSHKILVVPYEG
ncbi:RNA-binding protein, predicted [Ferroglobus placidus DSM 10642]|uniref:RNA-binding protein, predicted n=1 Tax=Ferroglobus placidus (strain DSM 10642 / AEDII12DO) TaxID=589924 RepID=D3RY94_FERPA|nr:CooT family nickel-binding protein [Ferroglobus placidus]ADC65457.1 RNA-binding protein, predicted [Ferroglobus placidus DSM 10642]